ncbi:MAG: hypothetical protein LJE69_02970 [Thiohalocapsa sp.]|uniref:hypothetical protein n=1 Tax=Thiohalocapsa sp. TaxID=2497641 RepID=UPI0025FD34B2|nr:hypothetical protein [Thiohalocapsa sp.]MCG6940196.1 hypothetical protein [Thiohalocapsa sp.]
MSPQDLSDWSTVEDLPVRSAGLITKTHAKRLFRDRTLNGLAAKGAAAMVGRKALVHVPKVLDHVLGQDAAA